MNPVIALMRALTKPAVAGRMWVIPSLPRYFRRHYASPRRPWDVVLPSIPAELLTVPGAIRDVEAEESSLAAEPLHLFHKVHEESIAWETANEWPSFLPVAPRLARAERAVLRTRRQRARARPAITDPAELARTVRERARTLGFGAVGVARYNPLYTYLEYTGHQAGDRVIVCVLEQNSEASQTTPSVRSNRAAYDAEAEGMAMCAELAKFLHGLGYQAHAHGTHEAVAIPYAVDAGLGQLGLNGQLLTPSAGARCRLILVTTDAPLELDTPVDYGIHGICDRCKACVQRCPAGAIPANREAFRGVVKAKINHARCFPTVAQADGCGVCMKVCPIQRYGLAAVLDEYARSGTILGRGTDELEGYVWPLDERRYGPGEKPRLGREFFSPPAMKFDPGRKSPLV